MTAMAPDAQTPDGQWPTAAAALEMAAASTPPPVDVAVAGGSEGANDGNELFEITTGQRMMSAMTGSLLTSLLGE